MTFGLIFIFATLLVRLYSEYDFDYAAIAIALTTSLYVLHDFVRRLFFSIKNSDKALIIDIVGYAVQPVVIIVLHQIDQLSLTTVLFVISGAQALGIVIAFCIYSFPKVNINLGSIIKDHWRFSAYLIGTSLLQWLSGNFFIAISAGILGPVAVGVVRMSQNIVGVLHVLFLAFENTIPLKAAEVLQKKGKVEMLQFIGRKIKQSIWPVAIILIAIVLLSKTIISQLYGLQYVEYRYVLYAFCLLYVFVFIGTFLRFVIRTLEHNRIIFISYIATSTFSLLLAKLMVEQMDISGVLLGLIISQIITNAIYVMALKKEIKWILK